MALKGTTTEEKIWNFLKDNGLNDFGAAGLMGNLYAESALRPTNLQNTYEKKLGMTDAEYTAAVDNGTYCNFVKDCAGYGLAQWTYWSRKQNLLDFAKSAGKSIGDLEMQLSFLIKELKSGYASVLQTLKTATSILVASNAVLLKYERPANQGTSVQNARASYGQKYYDKYAKPAKKEETPMSTKITTGAQLAAKAKDVALNYKTIYMWGVFGAPVTESVIAGKTRQYPSWYTAAKQATFRKLIGKGYFGFDCVCLIKGLLWGWCGDATKNYGGAKYASNGVPDIGADSMIGVCKDVSTDFSKIEVGEAVWCKGHIGIYIGGGLAVECTPAWKNCVQITACNCTKSGYSRRNWTKHGKLPYVSYTGASENVNAGASTTTTTKPSTNTSGKIKVGDIVEFTGTKHYASANAASGPACKPGKAKVTATYNGKHPYHLVAVSGGGSTVYGWVDEADIKGASTTQAAAWTPKVGDTVIYNGNKHYTSANSTAAKSCKGGKAKITQIYQLGKSKHPYHLVRVSGSGATVYGWVDAGTFTKA